MNDLIEWFEDELENGNRIKASKIFNAFAKIFKKKFPNSKPVDQYNYRKYCFNRSNRTGLPRPNFSPPKPPNPFRTRGE